MPELGAPSATHELAVVDPDTGEVFPDVGTCPPETLAGALLALKEHEAQTRTMRKRVEDELGQRMLQRERGFWLVGDYEVRLKQTRESDWDADTLEDTLLELVHTGVLDAREAVGVISHETVVHRAEASRLVKRLSGRARSAVERCCSWRNKGHALEVTRSIQLEEKT